MLSRCISGCQLRSCRYLHNTTGQKRHSVRAMASASGKLSYPTPITMNPKGAQPNAAVIFLHGLGDTANGWADVGPAMMEDLKTARFVFPTAPRRPITLNFGMAMTGWYDIDSLEAINMKEDAEGLKESQRYVEELVQQQVASGIPSERVVVGGFSQGGATALMLLRSNLKLGGIVGLSSYLPLAGEKFMSDENKQTPILMAHGDSDQVVFYEYGKQSAEKLKGAGANVTFSTYPGMPHTACMPEIMEVKQFIKTQLKL